MKPKKTEFTEEELISKLEELEIEKAKAISDQQYELASNIRDKYRKFNTMLEDLMNSHD